MPLQHHPVGSTKGSPRSPLRITSFLLLPHQAGAGAHQSCRSNPSFLYQCLAHARYRTSRPASSPVPPSPQYHHIPKSLPQVQVISTPAAALCFFSHLIKVSAPCPHPWGPLTSPCTPRCPRGHPHHSPPAPIPTRDPLGAQKVTAVLLGSAGILARPGARKAEENIGKKKKKKAGVSIKLGW